MESINILLENLLKFKTRSNSLPELNAVIDFVEDYLKDIQGVHIRRYTVNGKPSIYYAFNNTYHPEILFVGHLDVVDAKDEDFIPRREGSILYGRGSMDMKGSCAVMMELLREMSKETSRPNVGFLFTTDEEVGSEDGVKYLVEHEGIGGEFVIIPDGGEDFQLVVEGKGVYHVKIVAKGKATHGSRIFEGENALDKLVSIYTELKSHFHPEPCGDPEHWHNTINLGKMVGGDSVNRVPDYAEMYLDVRFVHPFTVSKIESMVRDVLSKYPGTEFETISTGEPVFTPRENPYIVRYKKVAESVLKRPISFIKEHGATDWRFFTERGMAVLITAPRGGNIHGNDEWVDLDSLKTLFEIFFRFVNEK
ncbi:MAG: M20/M25/M40 family metallo-hydrolase [Candidatus Hydrothermia bacterium]|nr:M20/M25/M40 family metallo-hydrolase [Candidatus Hydrothermia bacterium]